MSLQGIIKRAHQLGKQRRTSAASETKAAAEQRYTLPEAFEIFGKAAEQLIAERDSEAAATEKVAVAQQEAVTKVVDLLRTASQAPAPTES